MVPCGALVKEREMRRKREATDGQMCVCAAAQANVSFCGVERLHEKGPGHKELADPHRRRSALWWLAVVEASVFQWSSTLQVRVYHSVMVTVPGTSVSST